MAKQPLVVCDHFWEIPALNGFPGGYMKEVKEWFTPQDFLQLTQGKDDCTILTTYAVVYVDKTGVTPFTSTHRAQITQEPRGRALCMPVIIFDGQTQTFAELGAAGKQIHDMTDSAWAKFGAWLNQQ